MPPKEKEKKTVKNSEIIRLKEEISALQEQLENTNDSIKKENQVTIAYCRYWGFVI